MHKQGLGIAEIARRTGKDIGTVKKYRSGGNSLGTKRTNFIIQKLTKPCKIQKILFGRNLLAILQTAITKNKKKLKINKTKFKKELLTKISGSFFM